MKLTFAAAVAVVPLTMACPGSPVKMHAKCDMGVTFTNSCSDVMTEISNRVTSDWVDPHNGGTYTITNSTSTSIEGQRLTGDGKYTDKFDFEFTSSSDGGCSVEACSESQVNSMLDFSTNYCNLHDLYCSSTDGCPTVGKDLSYSEKYSSCRQHDVSACTPSKLTAKRVKGGDAQACSDDIKAATADITAASLVIVKATTDCADGYTDACNDDINAALDDITKASADITAAVYDCSGDVPTACSDDIDAIIADIAAATADCGTNEAKCTADISKAAADLTRAGFDIAKAATDCAV